MIFYSPVVLLFTKITDLLLLRWAVEIHCLKLFHKWLADDCLSRKRQITENFSSTLLFLLERTAIAIDYIQFNFEQLLLFWLFQEMGQQTYAALTYSFRVLPFFLYSVALQCPPNLLAMHNYLPVDMVQSYRVWVAFIKLPLAYSGNSSSIATASCAFRLLIDYILPRGGNTTSQCSFESSNKHSHT